MDEFEYIDDDEMQPDEYTLAFQEDVKQMREQFQGQLDHLFGANQAIVTKFDVNNDEEYNVKASFKLPNLHAQGTVEDIYFADSYYAAGIITQNSDQFDSPLTVKTLGYTIEGALAQLKDLRDKAVANSGNPA